MNTQRSQQFVVGSGPSVSDKLSAALKFRKFYSGLWHPSTFKDDLIAYFKSLDINVRVC